MNAAFRAARRPLVVGLALISSACAVDPKTGAQSIAGMKVSDDPCAKTATAVGAIIGAITGGVVANQINHRGDTKIIGITAGAGIGALIGKEVDRRRCELFKVAQKHNATMNVATIVLPEGPLAPPGATAETPERRDTAAAAPSSTQPNTPREVAAGLSVTLRDSGRQFETGSDQLTAQGRAFFVDVAEQYSYARQV